MAALAFFPCKLYSGKSSGYFLSQALTQIVPLLVKRVVRANYRVDSQNDRLWNTPRGITLSRFVTQGWVLFFRRSRRNRLSFAYREGLRFDIPAGNLQPRVRYNRVFAREARLDSPFFFRQQRDVVIFPEYRQYLFCRLPRYRRKSHLECQRR